MTKLEAIMNANNMNMKELARESGVSVRQIRYILKGETCGMSLKTAKKLADVLGVSVADLC